ncbi:PLP-dependent aminotransferase family protein [Polycladidibacter hongkongensis]|uniref:aminotransferase-like domain-containing protein n=1 Tax=Polycladidibacter hongkongensis TaxID=1647556 RepID=UPI00082BD172|nr:PLP-dependent aminotransferase family protein [Pseudovibrio hongkongensis]
MRVNDEEFAASLKIRRGGEEPLSAQLYRQVRAAVMFGEMPSGSLLPSTRSLARLLNVSRAVVVQTYELLAADGVLQLQAKARPRVLAPAVFEGAARKEVGEAEFALSERGRRVSQQHRYMAADGARRLLSPGRPDIDSFPRAQWGRALRRAAAQLSARDSSYQTTAAVPRLQRVLQGHLLQARGVQAKSEQVIVVPGVQAALYLCALIFGDEVGAALIEEPGYLGARAAFASCGLQMSAAAPGALAQKVMDMQREGQAPQLIYTSPSHQFPLGRRMPVRERLALIEAARTCGAMLLEDDYDSEFLFDGRPLVAMQGLSPENGVVYIGTASKSLLPAVRLAYVVVPEPFTAAFASAQRNVGALVNAHVQLAFAELIESGELRAHLRRISRDYAVKALRLYELVHEKLSGAVQAERPSGGLQMALKFVHRFAGVDDVVVARALNEKGFAVNPLSAYCLGTAQRGLVVGTADAEESICAEFCDVLLAAITSAAEKKQSESVG